MIPEHPTTQLAWILVIGTLVALILISLGFLVGYWWDREWHSAYREAKQRRRWQKEHR